MPLRREAFDGETLMIRVGGLTGGHSGVEIDKGRANADMVLGRLLKAASGAAEVRLVSAQGGSKDNAIPTAAEAVLATADGGAVRAAVERLTADLKKEYRAADPGLTVTVEAKLVIAQLLPERCFCFQPILPLLVYPLTEYNAPYQVFLIQITLGKAVQLLNDEPL